MKLILASASPRRLELLRRLGLDPIVDPAHVPEVAAPGESPGHYVTRLAGEKATAVAARHPGVPVLAGDTVVVLGERILEKPVDVVDAERMLADLSGVDHHVYTALALHTSDGLFDRLHRARVRFRRLTSREISAYVATGEPMDKAGSYGIQGIGGALVEEVEGDYSAVMGLSLAGAIELLSRIGWSWDPTRSQ